MKRIVILGFGSIGSGLLPLLLKHFEAPMITVVGGDDRNVSIAAKYGVSYVIQPLDQDNFLG